MNFDIYLKITSLIETAKKKGAVVLFGVVSGGVIAYLIFYNLAYGAGGITEIKSTEASDTAKENNQEVVSSESGSIFVDLSGAIENPGVYEIPAGSRIGDLLTKGGNFLSTASQDWVSRQLNLAQVLYDGQKIYIPFEQDLANKESLSALIYIPSADIPEPLSPGEKVQTPATGNETPNSAKDEVPDAEPGKINVNMASQVELESLKGIGKAYATRIMDNRPYKDIEDLVGKSGVPEKTLRSLADFITF